MDTVQRNIRTMNQHLLQTFREWQGKVKVKFSLEQAMKAQRGSRGIAVLFL
jgi:hypothetical protein